VGKPPHRNRRSTSQFSPNSPGRDGHANGRRQERGRRLDRRVLAIAGGVTGLIGVGLVVAALTVAAMSGAKTAATLPQGTQVFDESDHSHVTTPVVYDHTPPAGGAHNPTWLNCGVYTEQVPNENAVHSLEHGTVWITYQPTLAAGDVSTLQHLVTSNYVGDQRYLLLSPYSGLPAPVVASAWGAQLQVQSASDPRLLQFIRYFAGGSQGGEPGGLCTEGIGSPIE